MVNGGVCFWKLKTMKDKTLVISSFLLFSHGFQIVLSTEGPLEIYQTMIFLDYWF